ncbi:ferritin-like domain-containing protein [Hymenobacter rubidus]|uniref:ferritin-like domain-containing protein n=1 Tax=Hymenobacter rubidus TaxID=1441626 RepID=UPI00191F0D55|nr:ferritin-like domain-containing protein [Hymenobacter rubidus]
MSESIFSPAWRAQPLGRRGFLRVSAASAATAALIGATGCSTQTPTPVATDPYALSLSTGDAGLVQYAYLLAMAQATLYQKVVDAPPSDLAAAERAIFADLRDHEVVHREVFKYQLDPTASTVIVPADLAFSLKSFTLTTRAGVLAAAQQLEDLATAAYPVLLTLLTTTSGTLLRDLLLKTSSVHARHAATVRDLLSPGSFANDDVVENTGALAGQIRTKTPTEVNTALAPFFAPYVISIANLAVPV